MNPPSIHWGKAGGTASQQKGSLQNTLSQDTTIKYCLHCDWQVSASDGYTKDQRSRAAVDHHVETGHTVDSIR